ncbi:MAG TPA: BamA/TamA family outer membrane protein [Acidobacteriota bacterium]|nr:BamA/TamA family outer membrane protein [Acidobacteriota bacterium]
MAKCENRSFLRRVVVGFNVMNVWLSFTLVLSTPDESLYGKVIKEIRISQLKYTKEKVVTRELASKVGEPYTEANVTNDKLNLDRLRIFTSIEINAIQDREGVILEVNLVETFPYLPLISFDVSEENGVSAGPGVKALNLFGRAISLSAAARFGGSTSFNAKLESPWTVGHPVGYMSEYVYMDRFNEVDGFQEVSNALDARVGYFLGKRGRIGGSFSFLSVNSDTDGITLSPTNTDQIPGLEFFIGFDSRDLESDPHHGWWTEFVLGKSGKFLGGDANFWTYIIDVRRYQRVADRHTLDFFSLATLRTGQVDVDIPTYLEFDLGGTNTIRGWTLGSSSGKNQFINTVQYRYELMKRRPFKVKGLSLYTGLQIAVFSDFGIAWSDCSEFTYDNFIGGIGIGLRVLIPFVDVIRLDLAWGEPDKSVGTYFAVEPKPDRQRRRVR